MVLCEIVFDGFNVCLGWFIVYASQTRIGNGAWDLLCVSIGNVCKISSVCTYAKSML
jgi:hypothetical protein